MIKDLLLGVWGYVESWLAIIMPTWVILIPTVGLKFLDTSFYTRSSGQFLGEFYSQYL